ncbi:MAG: serine hydrolase domain-containing protein [Planctomycetota bacterium]
MCSASPAYVVVAVLLTATLWTPSAVVAQETPSLNMTEKIEQAFQSVLDEIIKDHPKAIGLLVHVEAPNESISWSGAAGFSDAALEKPLVANQPVWIASNTKTYVSAAILRLVEEGELSLNDSIDRRLSPKTNALLKGDGYNTTAITLQQLLNHTSGICDYAATENYFAAVSKDPKHRWTRDEQLGMAVEFGQPLGKPGEQFTYADSNYLLLTEVMEQAIDAPFYESMRTLLDYKKQKLESTWFISLEDVPANAASMAFQKSTSMKVDNQLVDPSFDLYGGGGLASTMEELARFNQQLFTGGVFDHKETLELMMAPAKPQKPMEGDYFLGLSSVNFDGAKGYGHGGFWGTAVNHFPKRNVTIAVTVLERDQRALRADISKAILKAIKQLKQ